LAFALGPVGFEADRATAATLCFAAAFRPAGFGVDGFFTARSFLAVPFVVVAFAAGLRAGFALREAGLITRITLAGWTLSPPSMRGRTSDEAMGWTGATDSNSFCHRR
jgi:hypothetical protein